MHSSPSIDRIMVRARDRGTAAARCDSKRRWPDGPSWKPRRGWRAVYLDLDDGLKTVVGLVGVHVKRLGDIPERETVGDHPGEVYPPSVDEVKGSTHAPGDVGLGAVIVGRSLTSFNEKKR